MVKKLYREERKFGGKTFIFSGVSLTKAEAKKHIKQHNLKVNKGKVRVIKGKTTTGRPVYFIYHRGGWER